MTQAHSNHVPLHWESLNFDCEAWCTPSRSRLLGTEGNMRPLWARANKAFPNW